MISKAPVWRCSGYSLPGSHFLSWVATSTVHDVFQQQQWLVHTYLPANLVSFRHNSVAPFCSGEAFGIKQIRWAAFSPTGCHWVKPATKRVVPDDAVKSGLEFSSSSRDVYIIVKAMVINHPPAGSVCRAGCGSSVSTGQVSP